MVRVPPPVYLAACLGLAYALHRYLPVAAIIPAGWRAVGWLPLALGGILDMITVALLLLRRTTLDPTHSACALVTAGQFAFSRNPTYLGMLLIGVGVALLLGTLTPWIGVVLLFLLLDRVMIPHEERMLTGVFGDAYRDYCRRVRRWC